VSLRMNVVITEEYNFMVNIEDLIGATEHVTLYTRCHINRCRYKRVGLYIPGVATERIRHVSAAARASCL
jgi:hypothetical protein